MAGLEPAPEFAPVIRLQGIGEMSRPPPAPMPALEFDFHLWNPTRAAADWVRQTRLPQLDIKWARPATCRKFAAQEYCHRQPDANDSHLCRQRRLLAASAGAAPGGRGAAALE